MRSQFLCGLWHNQFIQKTRSLAKHKRTAALTIQLDLIMIGHDTTLHPENLLEKTK